MKCNVGMVDKIIRIVVAIILAYVAYAYSTSLGLWQYLLYLIAIILIVTVFTGYCYLYKLIGANTCKK